MVSHLQMNNLSTEKAHAISRSPIRALSRTNNIPRIRKSVDHLPQNRTNQIIEINDEINNKMRPFQFKDVIS
jgi:hypothetical protein